MAGGGLGDCLTILNKWNQLEYREQRLIYYVSEKQKQWVTTIEEFWESQFKHVNVVVVPSIYEALRFGKLQGISLLNQLAYGCGPCHFGGGKILWFPFDALATPRMELKHESWDYPTEYCLLQSDSGTLPYGKQKHWDNVEWIPDFCDHMNNKGLSTVLAGTDDLGICGPKTRLINSPLLTLIDAIRGASLVVGLHGFITMAARYFGRPTLVKRENIQSSWWYSPYGWRRWSKTFSEHNPMTWSF